MIIDRRLVAVSTLKVDLLFRQSPGVQLEITEFRPEGDVDSALHLSKLKQLTWSLSDDAYDLRVPSSAETAAYSWCC